MNKYNKGFTLVELLIVIAIITMMIAILTPNFMEARIRARDAQRKSDLGQIQKALELYKMDQSPPAYPSPSAFPASFCNQCLRYPEGADCDASTTNVYMRKFPCDPGSINPTPYYYEGNGGDPLKYKFVACLENGADPDRDADTNNAACPGAQGSYTIHEP